MLRIFAIWANKKRRANRQFRLLCKTTTPTKERGNNLYKVISTPWSFATFWVPGCSLGIANECFQANVITLKIFAGETSVPYHWRTFTLCIVRSCLLFLAPQASLAIVVLTAHVLVLFSYFIFRSWQKKKVNYSGLLLGYFTFHW